MSQWAREHPDQDYDRHYEDVRAEIDRTRRYEKPTGFRICTSCGIGSLAKDWKGNTCPDCGAYSHV